MDSCQEEAVNGLVSYEKAKVWFKQFVQNETVVEKKRLIFACEGMYPKSFDTNPNITLVPYSKSVWDSVVDNKEKGGCTKLLGTELSAMAWVEVILNSSKVKTVHVYPIVSAIRWICKNGKFKGQPRNIVQRFNSHFYYLMKAKFTTGEEFYQALKNFRMHMLGYHQNCKSVPVGQQDGNPDVGTCELAGTICKKGRQNDQDFIFEVNSTCDVLEKPYNAKICECYLHDDFTTSNESFNQKLLFFRPKSTHFTKSERPRLIFAAMDWNAQSIHIDSSCVGRASVEGDTLEQILAYRLAWRSRLLAKLMAHPVLN